MPRENENENENIDNQNDNQEVKLDDVLKELQSLKNLNAKLQSDYEKANKAKQDLLNEVKTKKEILKGFEAKAEDEIEQEFIKKGDLDSLKKLYKQKTSQEFETALNEKDSLLKQFENEKNELSNKLKRTHFEIQVSNTLAAITDLQQGASEALKVMIERDSQLDENGNLVFIENGEIRTIVKNNKVVNLTLADYVAEKRKTQPFFFKNAQGNDTKSSKQNYQGKSVMTKTEYDNKIQELQKKGDYKAATALFRAKQNGDVIVE